MTALLLGAASLVLLVASLYIENDQTASVVAWGAAALGVCCYLVTLS